ncbi:formylglycine-generating enzyme family protein [Bythopirellula polymerisocia]|uniref:Serine/threonine-protein kinase pkn1 n=1 Tax=Bythopirellula polymerisocia TaxID=2528003 RepID=A0A5C6CWE8_9BACT|nr:formylglycine-generating enzyme family protein [Bythopirellula polymerisocia]TWU27857.1 Serine/threonine-protein kinase pkn1 [Bythopirellula polymerisocia]
MLLLKHPERFFLILIWAALSPQQSLQADGKRGLASEDPGEAMQSVSIEEGFMVPYACSIPGTEATFTMMPIPGGEFLLGSPTNEADRKEDEGPQVIVKVAPFWMGKCEVSWAEYRAFMAQYEAFKKLDSLRFARSRMESAKKEVEALPELKEYFDKQATDVDAVTCPTPLYDSSFTYAPGEEPEQPAVTMTQFAAKQYTKWLSGISGEQYRLPTEAEWEYAARAGTTSAYSFGDDPDLIEEFGWYDDNSDYETHAVGSKQPNAWGLYDMHGNAAEWVLDGYEPEQYSQLQPNVLANNAIAWPTKLFPRVIRGGSWLSPASDCRSAARQQSQDSEWNLSDPNLPKSPWWFTEEQATGVGFRIMRPLEPMDTAMQKKVWDADIKRIQQDVADRLDEGRGAQTAADERLPGAVSALKSSGKVE